ncbi:MAG: LPXTG cell wall anchor domain-containing protein [Eggerthellaceae bacterium]|jgi:LPXTG-motif cell wall-anchored protein
MQIPSDVLFGHDKVTYKVRAYTLYGMSETEETTVAINRLQNGTDSVRLNVNDDDIVSGTTTITANNGGDNTSTSIAVDGAAVGDNNGATDGKTEDETNGASGSDNAADPNADGSSAGTDNAGTGSATSNTGATSGSKSTAPQTGDATLPIAGTAGLAALVAGAVAAWRVRARRAVEQGLHVRK